jgi:hypothetical protein
MDDLFEHAMESERDKAINGFYTHFIIFLAVIAGLAIVNLVEGNAFWIQWVVLGWGIGIGYHAFKVFITRPRIEQQQRERRLARAAKRAGANAPQTDAAPEPMPATPADEPGKPV